MGLIFIRPWYAIFLLKLEVKKVTFDLTQDDAGKEIHLGVTSLGLVVFFNNIRINLFSWSKIIKISFKRKQFFISLRREPVRPLSREYNCISLTLQIFSVKSTIQFWASTCRAIDPQKTCGNLAWSTTHFSGCTLHERELGDSSSLLAPSSDTRDARSTSL